jgi:hydroxymethylpyrimidine/phosphomethylpyrimidine kinase
VKNLVVDPVMVATSGDRLLADAAVAQLRESLFPLAAIVTPNLPEAAALLGEPVASDEAGMLAQGRRLLALGPRAVLVKGGHGRGPEAADLLVAAGGHRRYAAPRVATTNTHGTGCTLSAAIAAGLAQGRALEEAVAAAKAYVTAALGAADRLHVGHGRGPLHHFHALWRD